MAATSQYDFEIIMIIIRIITRRKLLQNELATDMIVVARTIGYR